MSESDSKSTTPNHQYVYKILTESQWNAMQKDGTFSGVKLSKTQSNLISGLDIYAPIDVKDQYIHLSTQSQVPKTLELYFHNQSNVYLIQLENSKLTEGSLKYEAAASRNNDLFPHYFNAPLPMTAVTKSWKLEQDQNQHQIVPNLE